MKQIPFVGYEFEYGFQFTQAEVKRFAEVTGDFNPIHLDADYAAQTPFKKPIMHGFLSGSIFSKVFGTQYPGEGTIYMEQQMNFRRPMFVDTKYAVKFKVLECDHEKGSMLIDCRILNEEGKVCLDGNARLMNKAIFDQAR
jgi:acyl dehydratase